MLGLDTLTIALIIVGCVIAIGLLIGGFCCWKMRKGNVLFVCKLGFFFCLKIAFFFLICIKKKAKKKTKKNKKKQIVIKI